MKYAKVEKIFISEDIALSRKWLCCVSS